MVFGLVLFLGWLFIGSISEAAVDAERLECLSPRTFDRCERIRRVTDGTRFYLFTRKNPEKPEALHDFGRTLPAHTNFNRRYPTEIIVDGYKDSLCHQSWMRDIKNELLKKGNYNVILVNWNQFNVGNYSTATKGLKIVAKELAELIDNIKAKFHVRACKFHIVAHNLGAHLAGLVGQQTELGRITGLDPARISYLNIPENERLDRKDAKFVDVIHTNAGSCEKHLGYIYPLGDQDFFVGNGVNQYNCFLTALENFVKGDRVYAPMMMVIPQMCSSFQSVHYYKATINPGDCLIIGKHCNFFWNALYSVCDTVCNANGSNCAVMGMDGKIPSGGEQPWPNIFKVETTFQCPFCSATL